MALPTANALRLVADALDLSPILDTIGDSLTAAARDGLYETTITIKDSVFAGRLDKIGLALIDKGFAIGFLGNGSIQVSWAAV